MLLKQVGMLQIVLPAIKGKRDGSKLQYATSPSPPSPCAVGSSG